MDRNWSLICGLNLVGQPDFPGFETRIGISADACLCTSLGCLGLYQDMRFKLTRVPEVFIILLSSSPQEYTRSIFGLVLAIYQGSRLCLLLGVFRASRGRVGKLLGFACTLVCL